ncbi:hypothetical protein Y1Q_0003952 [Alligator mississippiensis]|uniref:Uncharacterized protein n=1 Tax=Alligator mississippiensis TaxID=8496 RepID=A0A151MVV2_ALLMI|nr:hypothetical protein Y1Q_0003952 [Alligator mississippiensis]
MEGRVVGASGDGEEGAYSFAMGSWPKNGLLDMNKGLNLQHIGRPHSGIGNESAALPTTFRSCEAGTGMGEPEQGEPALKSRTSRDRHWSLAWPLVWLPLQLSCLCICLPPCPLLSLWT